MRRFILALLLVFLMPTLSFSAERPNTPEDVIKAYLQAQNDGRLEDAYALLPESEKKIMSEADYIKFHKAYINPVHSIVYKKAKFEILQIERHGEEVYIATRRETPDSSAYFKAYTKARIELPEEERTDSKIYPKVLEYFKGNPPSELYEETFRLVKENNKWCVSERELIEFKYE